MCVLKSLMSKNDMMTLRIPYNEHLVWFLSLYATFFLNIVSLSIFANIKSIQANLR